MKKLTTLFILLGAISLYAQSSVGGYIGFGYSAFGLDDFSMDTENQAGYVPAGIQITLGDGMLQFGAELSYSVVPFTFDVEYTGRKVGETQITQLFAGGFLRVNIGNEAIQPYAKAGGGAYMGKLKWEPEEQYTSYFGESADQDFKTAWGFYIAAGVDIKLTKTLAIFGEIPFHVVKRKLDVEDAQGNEPDSFSANNWAILGGVRILFK